MNATPLIINAQPLNNTNNDKWIKLVNWIKDSEYDEDSDIWEQLELLGVDSNGAQNLQPINTQEISSNLDDGYLVEALHKLNIEDLKTCQKTINKIIADKAGSQDFKVGDKVMVRAKQNNTMGEIFKVNRVNCVVYIDGFKWRVRKTSLEIIQEVQAVAVAVEEVAVAVEAVVEEPSCTWCNDERVECNCVNECGCGCCDTCSKYLNRFDKHYNCRMWGECVCGANLCPLR